MSDIQTRGYAHPDVLVSTNWVAGHLNDPNVRLIESNEDTLLYAAGHVPGAVHAPLDRLTTEAARLDPARPTAVLCAGGYRSSAATSLLAQRGFKDVRNVLGGTGAWIAAGYAVERPVT